MPPFFFQNLGSSLLSLLCMLFQADCLFQLHLVVLLGFYFVSLSGIFSSAISFSVNFCVYGHSSTGWRIVLLLPFGVCPLVGETHLEACADFLVGVTGVWWLVGGASSWSSVGRVMSKGVYRGSCEVRKSFSSVQSLIHVRLFVTSWTAAQQASLSITNSWNLLKLMSIESVMPSNHLIICCPLLLLPSIFPSIRIFSNESAFHMRWPKYWSFSFNISPSNESQDLFPLGWTGFISLQSKGLWGVFSNTTAQKHQFFCAQISL